MWGDKNFALLRQNIGIEEKKFRPSNAKYWLARVPFLWPNTDI